MNVFDAIFVGAGISCLYAAYKYKLKYPDHKFIILEKSMHIGGRVDWDNFEDIEIAKGAGIIREKDKLFLELLDNLNVPYTLNKHKLGNMSIKLYIDKLSANLMLLKQSETFKEYATRILGEDTYNLFKLQVGYTDYENYDVKTAIKYYGFSDTYGNVKFFLYSWSQLIKALIEKIGKHNIHTLENVIKVKKNSIVSIFNKKRISYSSNNIYIGTTINVLRKFFPKNNAYNYIESQPFIRIYAKLNKSLNLSEIYHTDSPLQKIINITNNIYMIAYADNKNALYLNNLKKDELLHTLRLEFNDPEIKILKYVKYFWKHGTHYYKPLPDGLNLDSLLKQAKNPDVGIHVIGEVVSYNQGWIGSSLKTIEI